MNILLIQPPLNKNLIGAGLVYLSEPLALEYVSSCVLDYNVKILDMRVEEEEWSILLRKNLESFQPDIVGITCLTPDVFNVYKILQEVKRYDKNILTVVGGHHVTMMPMDFDKDFVDVIVLGEGQFTFRELVETYRNGKDFSEIKGIAFRKNGIINFTPERELINNLDDYPFPARELTAKYRNKYYRTTWRPVASLMTSRGCPFRCNFCSVWKHERGKYRLRSAENIVQELETIKEPYISICDDNFLQDVNRAEKLYFLIKERGINKTFKLIARSDVIVKHPDIIEKWREIGTKLVLIGIESIRDEELNKFNKHNTVKNNDEAINILHKNGIDVVAQFIIDTEYTEKDFEEIGNYVEKMNLSHPIFSVLTPLPGTDLYFEKCNKLLTRNYELFDFIHCVLPTKLPPEKFYKCLADLYLRAYVPKEKTDKISKILTDNTIEKLYLSICNAYKSIEYPSLS